MAKQSVRVGKIDLDTCGAALLLGVTRGDSVEVLRGGVASSEDLANPEVICIEVGGSGQTQLNNWDHHEEGGPTLSATRQVFARDISELIRDVLNEDEGVEFSDSSRFFQSLIEKLEEEDDPETWKASIRLVNYIDQLDTKGPQSLTSYGEVEFPTLSDVFAGILLATRDPVEQLHKGIELLSAIARSGKDPYGTIKGFDSYVEAKAENNRQIAKAVKEARWDATSNGLVLGVLETSFFGAPGALYGAGARVVVALNPNLNGIRKFTIAGNGIRIDAVAPLLNARESGWGGPPTGTIVGSPREGSKLSLEEVIAIVKTAL